MAGLAEATRVFGNLSREATVRDFLAEQKGKSTPERFHKIHVLSNSSEILEFRFKEGKHVLVHLFQLS